MCDVMDKAIEKGRTEERENSLRKFCMMIVAGDLSMEAAVRNAVDYGITSEADLRRRAAEMGIPLPE